MQRKEINALCSVEILWAIIIAGVGFGRVLG